MMFNTLIITKFICFVILFYLLILFITFIKNSYFPQYSIEQLKNDNHLFLIFLDRFYIKNKLFTFCCCILYVIFYFLIFVFFRYLLLGYIYIIPTTDGIPSDKNIYINIILLFLAFTIILILYRSLLNTLFKNEINKFLIYISSFYDFYYKFLEFIEYDVLDMFLGTLMEFFYRTSNQTYKEDLYPSLDMIDDEGNAADWICDDEDDYQVRNKYLIRLAYATQNFLQDHKNIKKLFKFIAYIFRFLHIHAFVLKYYFIHFLIVLCFLYDVYNKELKTIYIILFIWIIVKFQRDFCLFITTEGYQFYLLGDYFYNNKTPYEKQRLHLFNKNDITIINFVKTETYQQLIFYKKEILKMIITNNFGWNKKKTFYPRSMEPKYTKDMYRRFYIILLFLIIYIYCYLYLQDRYYISSPLLLLFIILIFFILLIYCYYKTYHVIKKNIYYICSNFKYNMKFNIMYWILVLLQTYFFWFILFKPELFLLNTEILCDTNYLTIIRILTIDEKIIYFFNYYDYEIATNNDFNIDDLRYCMRQLQLYSFIGESTTILDIQVYIKDMIENYKEHEFSKFWDIFLKELLQSGKDIYKNNYNSEAVFFVLLGFIILTPLILSFIMKNFFYSFTIPLTKKMLSEKAITFDIRSTQLEIDDNVERMALLLQTLPFAYWNFYRIIKEIIINIKDYLISGD